MKIAIGAVATAVFLACDVYAQTIILTVSSDLAGVTFSGSGTHNASFNSGLISKNGMLPTGLSVTRTATRWSISSPFDVTVTKDLTLGSLTYTLQAQLSSPDASHVWKVDSI